MFQPLWGHDEADIQNTSRNCTHHLWKRDLSSYRLCYKSSLLYIQIQDL